MNKKMSNSNFIIAISAMLIVGALIIGGINSHYDRKEQIEKQTFCMKNGGIYVGIYRSTIHACFRNDSVIPSKFESPQHTLPELQTECVLNHGVYAIPLDQTTPLCFKANSIY